jgi:elongation factor Ts
MITIDQVKQLREETGVSINECKKALEESKGDFPKAKEFLRMWGKELANKKSSRHVGKGIIECYVHPTKRVGVMLDMRCESDFVSGGEAFKNLAHEICLQIAAMKPMYLKMEDIPEEFLDGERKIYKEQLKDSDKAKKITDEIIENKLEKYKKEISLLSQAWVKEPDKTIKDLVDANIAKIGENIVVEKFTRYEI